MAGLNNFTPVGTVNVLVTSTPTAVQVTGTTCLITNLGGSTVYGTIGGSAASAVPTPAATISGSGVNSASFTNITGINGGIAVTPLGFAGSQVAVAIGANSYLWLVTLPGAPPTSVNVAIGV